MVVRGNQMKDFDHPITWSMKFMGRLLSLSSCNMNNPHSLTLALERTPTRSRGVREVVVIEW